MQTKKTLFTLVIVFCALVSIQNVNAENASSSVTIKRDAAIEKKISKWQNTGSKEIDRRIASLDKISMRIDGMKNLTSEDKNALKLTIGSISSGLAELKIKIANETSTTTLAENVKSINQAYRIYALMEPQLHIIIAADRLKTVITDMTTVAGKLQSRLAMSTSLASSTAVQNALSDFTVEINNATTQAQAAMSLITPLTPDMGDKVVMEKNTKALKDARTKIKSAQESLKKARKDLGVIAKAISSENKDR